MPEAAPPGTTAQGTGATAQNASTATAGDSAAAASAAAGSAAAGAAAASTAQPGTATAATAAGEAWAADWREKYSKEDAGRLNVLKRYESPSAALDALFAARQRIESGDLKAALPKDANPAQLAAYREAHGVPDKPEGYLVNLPADIKVPEFQKEAIDGFAKEMHAKNVPAAFVHDAIRWQNQRNEQMVAKQVEDDNAARAKTEDGLRAEWGVEYRSNLTNIHNFMDTLPEGVSESILQARLPDGTAIANKPEVLQWLARMAREVNPYGVIVPGVSGGTTLQGVENRIGELNKMMGDRNSAYWKGGDSEKLQKEYRDLIDARDVQKRRSAA